MSLRFLTILAFAAATLTSACSTGFVKGWRDKEAPDTRSEQDKCTIEGWSWVGGACTKNSEIDLSLVSNAADCESLPNKAWTGSECIAYEDATESQCADLGPKGWDWLDGKCLPAQAAECVAKPDHTWSNGECIDQTTVSLSGGALTQELTAGVNFTAIDLKLPNGAVARLADGQTCEAFFSISGPQLVSKNTYDIPAGKTVCEADLIVESGATGILSKHLVATVARGFFAICADPGASYEETRTVFALLDALDKADCKEANEVLVKTKMLLMPGVGLRDIGALRGLKDLAFVDLSGNRIEDASPLASLTGLQKLLLDGNDLGRDVAKTEANCPTAAGTPAPLAAYCKL